MNDMQNFPKGSSAKLCNVICFYSGPAMVSIRMKCTLILYVTYTVSQMSHMRTTTDNK